MPDNTTFQSATLATPPAGLGVALKKATFSGDADQSFQLIELVSLTGSEGSWTVNSISDASGLIVQDGGNSLTVDNAGTFAVQEDGPALTALQLIDDAIYSDDVPFTAGSSKLMAVGFRYDDVVPDSITEGDVGYARISANRSIYVELRDGAGNERGVNVNASNELTVSETNSAAILADTASMDTNLTTLAGAVAGTEMQVDVVSVTPDLMLGTDFSDVLGTASLVLATQADDVANTTDAVVTSSFLYGFDGTTWDRLRGDATNGLLVNLGGNNDVTITGTVTVTDDGSFTLAANDGVDIGDVTINNASIAVTNAGTFAVQEDGAALTALQLIDDIVHVEDVAHNTGDSGAMVLAVRNDAGTALAGTTGDYIPLTTDSSGNLYVNVAAGSSAGTEYTEDDSAPANPAGPAVALVRQDTPATLTSTDGDIVAQRATNFGAAFVQILDSSGNFINTFGGSGGTAMNDDSTFTPGTDQVTPAGFLADETTPDSVDEGDIGAPRMTLSRKAYAVLADPTSENNAGVDASGHLQVDIAADSVGIGGGTQHAVDDALGATPVGTLAIAIRDDALSALTPIEGDAVGLRVDSTGALWVTTDDTITVTDDGSFTLAANDGVDIGDVTINNASIAVTSAAALDVSAATVTVDSELPTAAALTDNFANPTAPAVGSFAMVWDGATWDRAPGTSADGLLVNLGGNNDVTVSGTVTADAGTGPWPVTDNGGSLTVDAPVATPVNVQLSDGTDTALINGSGHLQVDIATDSVGIGGTQHAVDDALGATPTGTLAIAIRDDALTTLTPVEGDAIGLRVDSTGALWVATDDTITVTDDGSFTLAANDGVDIGDVTINNASIAVTSAAALDVSAATVTVDSELPTAAALTDNFANPTAPGVGAFGMVWDGATWDRMPGTSADGVTVNLGANNDVTVTGTVTVDLGANNDIQGDVAHDGVDSGNPVKVGLKAIAHSTNPTAVAADDRTDWYANRHGVPWVIGGHPNVQTTQLNVTDADGAQTDTAIITVAGGTKIVVTHITVTADNANTVDVQCRIGFGATNTPGNDAADVILSHPGIAAGSGVSVGSGAGIIGVGADGEDLRVTCEDPTSGNLDIVVGYYTIES